MVLSIVGIATFFILQSSDDCNVKDNGNTVNNSFEIAMLLALIIMTLCVYAKIVHLDVNPNPISFLDDLLLLLCVPMFFFYAVVHMAPMIKEDDNWTDLLTDILMVVQVTLQTPMIMDGLRRLV